MLTRDQALLIVQNAAQDVFGCEPEAVGMETVAADVNGWDSMTHTIFLLAIEQQLKIQFDPYEMHKFATVSDLIAAMQRLAA